MLSFHYPLTTKTTTLKTTPPPPQVEEDWKLTEFTAIPHGKDVYILGGLDEIMALLDDSVVNISTIAGSRHVGPIKPRVEDWQKQLALFADTLVC